MNIFSEQNIDTLCIENGRGTYSAVQCFVYQLTCDRRWSYSYGIIDARFTYEHGNYTLEYTKTRPGHPSCVRKYSGQLKGNRLGGTKLLIEQVNPLVIRADWKEFNDYKYCTDTFSRCINFGETREHHDKQSFSGCLKNCVHCIDTW